MQRIANPLRPKQVRKLPNDTVGRRVRWRHSGFHFAQRTSFIPKSGRDERRHPANFELNCSGTFRAIVAPDKQYTPNGLIYTPDAERRKENHRTFPVRQHDNSTPSSLYEKWRLDSHRTYFAGHHQKYHTVE